MKKILALLALVSLVFCASCSGRGEVFGWGQDYGPTRTYYAPMAASPCGG